MLSQILLRSSRACQMKSFCRFADVLRPTILLRKLNVCPLSAFASTASSNDDTEQCSSSTVCIAKRVTGSVKWFHPSKGYGFIVRDDTGQDLFVHSLSILNCAADSGHASLFKGEPVQFDVIKRTLGDGRKQIEADCVTGPDGAAVKGSPPKIQTNSSASKFVSNGQRLSDVDADEFSAPRQEELFSPATARRSKSVDSGRSSERTLTERIRADLKQQDFNLKTGGGIHKKIARNRFEGRYAKESRDQASDWSHGSNSSSEKSTQRLRRRNDVNDFDNRRWSRDSYGEESRYSRTDRFVSRTASKFGARGNFRDDSDHGLSKRSDGDNRHRDF